MIIQIKLTDKSPPFWFLGDPKNLIVNLNFRDPGPVQVNFEELSESDRKKIIQSMQLRHIDTDVNLSELNDVHLRLQSPFLPSIQDFVEPSGPLPVAEEIEEKKPEVIPEEKEVDIKKVQSETIKQDEKDRKFNERCQFLIKQNFSALKSTLKDCKDVRLLRFLKETEKKRKKPRLSVLLFLEDLMAKVQGDIVKSIENDSKTTPVKYGKQETFQYDVIESEEETVHLSEKDIEKFALGETFGGD